MLVQVRSHSPALAIVGRRALWCNFSARAIATVIRSCLSHERSRRCRRLIAALSYAAKGCPHAILTCRILANKGSLGSNLFFLFLVSCFLFLVCRLSFVVCRLSFVVCRLSFVVCRVSCVVPRSSFLVPRSSCVVCCVLRVVCCVLRVACCVLFWTR